MAVQLGISTDKLTPADFDGDDKDDIAVWREAPATRAGLFFAVFKFNFEDRKLRSNRRQTNRRG